MNTVQSNLIKYNLLAQFNHEAALPINVVGPRGIGKSEHIKQITSELGATLLHVSLPSKSLAFMTGIPDFIESDVLSNYSVSGANSVKETQWSAPEMVAQANKLAIANGRCVLFLDDIHTMNQSMESVMYELLLERKLGDIRLDNNVAIVCAMNASKESGGGKLSEPIKNRLQMLQVDFDFDVWFKKFGIVLHHWISSFLKTNPGNEHNQFILENESIVSTKIAGSPRSWEYLANAIESYPADFALDNLQLIASQFISTEAATELVTHVTTMEAINFPELIKSDTTINLKELGPLAQVTYSYIVNYAKEIEDAVYIIDLINANDANETFSGYLIANLYSKHTRLMSGKAITPAQQCLLDKLLAQFDPKQKLPTKHKTAIIDAEIVNRIPLLALAGTSYC